MSGHKNFQSDGGDLRRLRTADLELGVNDALARHVTRHVVPPKPVSQRRLDYEHRRPRWLRECMAEATGVFYYVFPGIASLASFTINLENPVGVTAFGSIFQIGLAFAFGIAFAIITCAPTSGGHFNPAITLSLAIYQGFPWKKVPYYIFSQIFGSFMAGLLVVGMYHVQFAAIAATGADPNLNGGLTSILVAVPNPNQTNLGYLFLIEFFVDSFIAIVIWAVIDPANPFVAPAQAPFAIGLAYAVMVWGFGDITISTNLARDLGCRIVAAIFYGGGAFSYDHYSWIAILVNIPATLFGVTYYELVLRDSLARISHGHAQHEDGEDGIVKHLTRTGAYEETSSESLPHMEAGYANAVSGGNDRSKTYA